MSHMSFEALPAGGGELSGRDAAPLELLLQVTSPSCLRDDSIGLEALCSPRTHPLVRTALDVTDVLEVMRETGRSAFTPGIVEAT